MKLNCSVTLCLSLILVCFFTSIGFCASSYDRELIVQDKTRAMQVESVFKELMAAYEDEDARTFLDYVSDDRFRQDYITFTDALYSDFRNYEIHQVEYWIDRVVPDNVKQFLYVQWEKRYENLDDGRQTTQKGFSRFLFDEVDGDYLLIELAGNHLFGGSLQEWVEEVPPISGQEATVAPQEEEAVCDSTHLSLCDGANCSSNGGYWDGSTCTTPPAGAPDLEFTNVFQTSMEISFQVINTGTAASVATGFSGASGDIPSLSPGQTTPLSYSTETIAITGAPINGQVVIDPDYFTNDSDRSNNTLNY